MPESKYFSKKVLFNFITEKFKEYSLEWFNDYLTPDNLLELVNLDIENLAKLVPINKRLYIPIVLKQLKSWLLEYMRIHMPILNMNDLQFVTDEPRFIDLCTPIKTLKNKDTDTMELKEKEQINLSIVFEDAVMEVAKQLSEDDLIASDFTNYDLISSLIFIGYKSELTSDSVKFKHLNINIYDSNYKENLRSSPQIGYHMATLLVYNAIIVNHERYFFSLEHIQP